MDRCAVLVDAGYLLGAAGTLLGGDADRSNLEVQYESLVRALIDEARRQTGIPVLRVLWYDAAYNAQPTPEHRALRVLPDVKVRLGELVKRGNRVQQKGVDSYLQRDLTALARNHAVADAVLVGGDEDLRRALEEAQDYGVRVHLWGVEAAAPEYNQSQSLIGEADRRWVISGEWIGAFVRLRDPATTTESEASDTPPAGEPAPEPPRVTAVRATPRASPADIARLQAVFNHRDGGRPEPAARTGRGWEVRSAEHDDIPRLKALTTERQAWLDNEEDATQTTASPAEVGARFGSRWAARASREQREALLANQKPPPYLDGELLRYAERSGIDTWDDEPAKHAVRGGFWESVSRSQP